MLTDPVRLAFRPPGSLIEPPAPDGGPPLDPDQAIPIPGDMTFDEFLEGLNPLHHLPVVGMIYRGATGRELHPTMRILGSLALGGPAGLVATVGLTLLEMSRPMDRIAAAREGRPDPWMQPGAPLPAGASPQMVADAYRRWGRPGAEAGTATA